MWPSFRLTKTEAKYNIKYNDPRKREKAVLHRKYGGKLELNPTKHRDMFTFQIARRCRVMGFTVAGDITEFLITMSDVSGEQYLATPTPVSGLVCGYNMLPLSGLYNPADENDTHAGTTLMPYIFEPNIVLPPNNTLTITATPTSPSDSDDSFRIDFVLHVYEFPGMPGSPV